MSAVLVTPPASAPISLTEAKAQCRVDHDDDDALIQGLIDAAVGHLDGTEGVLGRALVPQTWRDTFDAASVIDLPLGPVSSITSVTYGDADTVVAAEIYRLVGDGALSLAPGASWPGSPLTVTWVAGVGCPAVAKAAMLILIEHWYDNRSAMGQNMHEIPFSVRALLTPLRRVGV